MDDDMCIRLIACPNPALLDHWPEKKNDGIMEFLYLGKKTSAMIFCLCVDRANEAPPDSVYQFTPP
jgi:hypothetical protein